MQIGNFRATLLKVNEWASASLPQDDFQSKTIRLRKCIEDNEISWKFLMNFQ